MFRVLVCSLIALCMFYSSFSYTNVVMATRVVYPSDQKSVSLELTNMGSRPSLVQAWIDNGDPTISPEKITAPFVITPPVSRVDGGKGQTLRVTYTGAPLPSDKESIFYLNILDIPPKPQAEEAPANYLQIAIRSRIKLFFRPKLKMTLNEAYSQVKWTFESSQGKSYLIADNQTPYYITYNNIEVEQGNRINKVIDADMVAPYSKARFTLSQANKSNVGTIKWSIINDYGAKQIGTTILD